ncbi:hypothetical protein [Actinoplanes sp. NBRC 103695]|uniref:hypothetical protein n=1 Tax=Actinoplanes sp. NBRC 103695 TaxID=3032202 RepID=UPI002553FB98|nr:hypothetical protein [Actinoplanes sp. NBRC 103695]
MDNLIGCSVLRLPHGNLVMEQAQAHRCVQHRRVDEPVEGRREQQLLQIGARDLATQHTGLIRRVSILVRVVVFDRDGGAAQQLQDAVGFDAGALGDEHGEILAGGAYQRHRSTRSGGRPAARR